MVFMIGVGWEGGEFKRHLARAKNLAAEEALLDQFSAFLELKAGAG
jgi:hypothetical protein